MNIADKRGKIGTAVVEIEAIVLEGMMIQRSIKKP